MKPMTTALAIGGACAACCAVSLLAGAGLFAAAGGVAYLGGAAGIALAAAGALVWHAMKRRTLSRGNGCAAPACGCSVSRDAPDDKAIACTLGGDDFKNRAAWIRGIAERHLKRSLRSPLTLLLVYGKAAAADLREMVRRERECCAFLRFELAEDEDEVRLLITAPEAAREAAGFLFDHFAPQLAGLEARSDRGAADPISDQPAGP